MSAPFKERLVPFKKIKQKGYFIVRGRMFYKENSRTASDIYGDYYDFSPRKMVKPCWRGVIIDN